MLEFRERVDSDEFAQFARRPVCPRAFRRSHKLPVSAMVGALLSMRSQCQQAMVKRLKHRLLFESVSGLSQQALIIAAGTKVLASRIASVTNEAAAGLVGLPVQSRKCNRSCAAGRLQRMLPKLMLRNDDLVTEIAQANTPLARTSYRFVKGRSQLRSSRHGKRHPSGAASGGGCSSMDWILHASTWMGAVAFGWTFGWISAPSNDAL